MRKAEEQGQLSSTCDALGRYLGLNPGDGQTWRWYAQALDQNTTGGLSRDRLYLVFEEALRHNPDDATLERRCVDLAMELRPQRTKDAKRHLAVLLSLYAEKAKQGSASADATRELAELKELEGQCLFLEGEFAAAANAFSDATRYDPTRLACYVHRARLLRGELQKNAKDSNDEIDRMVANNPKSGVAYLYRFRYASEFQPPAADGDFSKALSLAPDNPEVLLTAAQLALLKRDRAAARSFLDRGMRLSPQNPDLTISLARLELLEQQPHQAEAVLRQTFQARPQPNLCSCWPKC